MAEHVYLLEILLGHRIDEDGWGRSTKDYFYVADTSNSRIKKQLCSDLSYVDEVASGDYATYGVCSDGTYFYTTNAIGDEIKKYKCSDLSLVASFGSAGAGNDQFSNPDGICTDGEHLYISDTANDRIKKHLCSDLNYVAQTGTLGTANAEFDDPRGICTDDTHIYIADRSNQRIKKHLCSTLAYVTKIGSNGSGPDQFLNPQGICTDKNHLYIADTGNGRIKKHLCLDLSYDSHENGSHPNDIRSPYGICTDDIYIYHADQADDNVQKRLCSDLSFDSKQGSTGAGDANYNLPYHVGFSQEGYGSWYISHTEGKPVKVEELCRGTMVVTEYEERVTLILCNDNPSSWYWDLANSRLYVHTSGSDDPSTADKYIILSHFWEYLTNAQYVDEDIIFNDNEYLPYLNDSDIPDVNVEASEYNEGGIKQNFGSIRIINADGRYDSRLEAYIYENRKANLLIGAKGDVYGDFEALWSGWTGGVAWSEEEIEIDIEDFRMRVE